MAIFKNDWSLLLEDELKKSYYLELRKFLIEEYKTKHIYPDKYDIYNALHYTAYEKTKIVILGQDPYHGPGQAHGLSFSVKPGVQPPPSLQNIFKELKDDLGCYIPNNGYLVEWAKQGILMLNTVLTVRKGEANSHRGIGWEKLTDRVIELLNEREKPIIFILWGRNAQDKERLIKSPNHYIIKAPHPSPLSAYRGFFGSRVFSTSNSILKDTGQEEINWQISNL